MTQFKNASFAIRPDHKTWITKMSGKKMSESEFVRTVFDLFMANGAELQRSVEKRRIENSLKKAEAEWALANKKKEQLTKELEQVNA